MTRRVIAAAGPTATGKTGLAIEIARRVDGEIVNADSRQVYAGMDIGTAKPSAEEFAAVPHHLFGHVRPEEHYSLGVYREQVSAAFEDIWQRGKVPILTGGTGQYVWAVLENWSVPEVAPDVAMRTRLEAEAAADGGFALFQRLKAADPVAALNIDARNIRRVIRALEVTEITGKPFSELQTKGDSRFEWAAYGIAVPRDVLDARIDARVDQMFADGFEAEVVRLRAEGYGRDLPSMSSIGYSQVHQYLDREISLAEAISETKRATRRLSRKQAAWFRPGDPRMTWLAPAEVPVL